MIHRPSVYAAGMVDDMEKVKDVLMKIEVGITPIYAKRTGLSDEKITEPLEGKRGCLPIRLSSLVLPMRCPRHQRS